MKSPQRSLTPARTGASPVADIVILDCNGAGQKFPLDGSATLGRSSPATIVFDDPEVSRLHARIAHHDGGDFLLEDLGSRNGTFVNGTRCERRLLTYGDKVQIGSRCTVQLSRLLAVEEDLAQRQRFEAIGRLGVSIGNELNNVLAALGAGAVFLRDLDSARTLGDPEVRDCISDLVLAAERADGLTRGILAFARGRRPVREPVDVSALGWEVVRMLRHTLDPSIGVEPDIHPDVLVQGDSSALHQVLLNLCLNARDAMPNGGPLRIAVRFARAPWVFGLSAGESVALLSVADRGNGVEPNGLSRIFEPFFTTKGEGTGYGLGLATVREIVSLHGGHLSIDSDAGQGRTFNVYLPLPQRNSGCVPAVESKRPARRHTETPRANILIVDDERMVRRSLARLLRQAGFEVTEAADGVEGIAHYQSSHYDLVIMDLDMPGMDGEEALAHLMRLDPQARVLFATGHADPERESAVRARGALAFLQKPVSLDTLRTLLRDVLERDDEFQEFEKATRPTQGLPVRSAG